MFRIRYFLSLAGAVVLGIASVAAHAHTGAHASRARPPDAARMEEKAFGRPGDPGKVTRTVRIDMSDAMRFSPNAIAVKQGDTIRFVVKNSGKAMHELVIGTMAELKEHSDLMRKFPSMEHDEPYMAHVEPGKTVDIVWQFTRAGEFHYGCLIPGHFEAGMIGRINVQKR